MTTPLRLALPRSEPLPRPSDDTLAHHLVLALEATTDLASWSDELKILAGTSVDNYHLAPSRANILRAFERPALSTVLEIGARAGALTRYLGETYRVVDALEPDPAMAAVAEARCAGLESVAVHATWLDTVPKEPIYDLIVVADVADVLRQQGGALADLLAVSRSMLAPGGVILLAFDNQAGVRFLAGDVIAPLGETSHGRPPRLPIDQATSAVSAAGLEAVVLHAFPDHRHTHVLFDHDALAAIDPSLLTKLPNYGSDIERRLWTEMVDNGTSAEHANSIVVLASEDGDAPASAATYWSDGRAAAQSACNRFLSTDSGVVVERGRTFPDAPAAAGPLHLRPHTEPFIGGTSLVRALTNTTDVNEAQKLLRAWADLVARSTPAHGPMMWDLIPRNVIVTTDGSLQAIDQEWALDGSSAAAVLARGCFWLAVDLSSVILRPSWLAGLTIRDRALFLHTLAGCEHDPHWFETFVHDEAHHASYVWPSSSHRPRATIVRENWKALNELSTHHQDQPERGGSDPSTAATLSVVIDDLAATNSDLRAEIEALKLQQRHATLVQRDHLIGLNSELEQLREQLNLQLRVTRRTKARATRLDKELRAVRASSTWRIGRILTRPLSLLRRNR